MRRRRRTCDMRVERLLAADGIPGGSLSTPEAPLPRTGQAATALAADRVFAGRYELRQKLGEGGMGEVWVADQTQPVRRRVAIKVVRTGIDSARMLARFDQERQALALMDHPNIAKVFDAGIESGLEDQQPEVTDHEPAGPMQVHDRRLQPPLIFSALRRDGTDQGHVDHPVLRQRQAFAPRPPRTFHPRLSSRPARPSEGNHSPRSQAL